MGYIVPRSSLSNISDFLDPIQKKISRIEKLHADSLKHCQKNRVGLFVFIGLLLPRDGAGSADLGLQIPPTGSIKFNRHTSTGSPD